MSDKTLRTGARQRHVLRTTISHSASGKGPAKVLRIPLHLLTAILLLGALSAPALADVTYTFDHIVEPGDDANALASGAIGEAQLFVDVAPYDANRVLFTFTNIGPEACSIADIYFDDGALLRIASLVDADDGTGGDSGVDFTELADPDELPGGTLLSPPFVTSEGFSADADPPPAHSGVDPNESLGIIFELAAGRTYPDVLSDLACGDLRMGIHVQNFDYGRSESFVNGPPVEQCGVTATAGPGGSIDPNGRNEPNCGQCVTFQATPDTCYEVDTWYLDGHDLDVYDPNYTLCVTGNHTVHVTFKPLQPVVPDMVCQMDVNEAVAAIGAIEYLSVGSIVYQCNETWPLGHVIGQNPPAGPTACNTAVDLVVSTGPAVVPNVVGELLADANAAIAASLVVGSIDYECSDTVAAGRVISQDPAGGETVNCGSSVNMVVSTGPAVVPNVVGELLADANGAIIAASLVVGSILPRALSLAV
jgi:hypothetical protein